MAKLTVLEALKVLSIYARTYCANTLETGIEDVQKDIDAVSEAYETLKSELAAIIAASSDDSASAIEIIDARIAQGGTVYTTLGEHIRAIATGDALSDDSISASHLQDASVTTDKLAEDFTNAYYNKGQVDKLLENVQDDVDKNTENVSNLQTAVSELTVLTGYVKFSVNSSDFGLDATIYEEDGT